jgi:hypothetical protein
MIPAFEDIEYNVANGGGAQFLWNCFGYWGSILDTAEEGYLLIGVPAHSAAMNTLRTFCERDERECGETIKRSIRDDDGVSDGP